MGERQALFERLQKIMPNMDADMMAAARQRIATAPLDELETSIEILEWGAEYSRDLFDKALQKRAERIQREQTS